MLSLFFPLLSIIFFLQVQAKDYVIMLDPAGDAQYAGRSIEDSLERGLTLQCAEYIKNYLERNLDNVKVVLTRFQGETVQTFQNANFANRLAVDLYISIHFYQEYGTKPEFFIYTYTYENQPFLPTTFRSSAWSFCSFDDAYLTNQKHTTNIATTLKDYLQQHYHTWYTVQNYIKLPFKPLMGIIAPTIACEIGLKQKTDWLRCAEVLAKSLESSILEKNLL